MLIGVCHIVTAFLLSLGLTPVSLLPCKIRLPSLWFTYFTRPPPFILVLGMLIGVCHIVTQSSFPTLTPVSLLPRKIRLPSLWFTYFTRLLPPHLCNSKRYWP
ncbi:unnamed protein product [Protopolystoma xenopodis]|uniref:Uncharacterized protein n=1 Tax=Protopolystoma xenopodis TaxID=117903 RepID=A0A448XSR6_9PLAT|nr:unnamed protein product [Protopolystoma xenopodis]